MTRASCVLFGVLGVRPPVAFSFLLLLRNLSLSNCDDTSTPTVTMASLKRSDFEPEAETRPSKRATASSANGGVREALAPNIDKDPTTPRRDQRRPSQSRIVIRDEKDSSSEASSASEVSYFQPPA